MPPEAKVVMWDAGVFKGADIIVRSHWLVSTTRAGAGFRTCFVMNIDAHGDIRSYGAPAHQLTSLESDANALELSVELLDDVDSVAATCVRRHAIQGIITEGGAARNADRPIADVGTVRYPDAVSFDDSPAYRMRRCRQSRRTRHRHQSGN